MNSNTFTYSFATTNVSEVKKGKQTKVQKIIELIVARLRFSHPSQRIVSQIIRLNMILQFLLYVLIFKNQIHQHVKARNKKMYISKYVTFNCWSSYKLLLIFSNFDLALKIHTWINISPCGPSWRGNSFQKSTT